MLPQEQDTEAARQQGRDLTLVTKDNPVWQAIRCAAPPCPSAAIAALQKLSRWNPDADGVEQWFLIVSLSRPSHSKRQQRAECSSFLSSAVCRMLYDCS